MSAPDLARRLLAEAQNADAGHATSLRRANLLREAAAAVAETDVSNSDRALYAKILNRLRDTLSNVKDHIEDEGDRMYFGSTNDADALSEIAHEIEALHWDEIMEHSQPPVDLYAIIKGLRADKAAAEASNAKLREALERAESFIAGFEGDELQEGIDELLVSVRDALSPVAPDASGIWDAPAPKGASHG